jgi:hypothetical protein
MHDRPPANEVLLMNTDTIYLVANGDLRPAANRTCWPAQAEAEARVVRAIETLGRRVRRAHEVDPIAGHGFIDSQKRGIEVFRDIPPEAPLVVVTAVWQYSQHVLPGLLGHRGPILTVANWSGRWPGLVGLLNLNASLHKAGVPHDSLWSEQFDDDCFRTGLARWLRGERIQHEEAHVQPAAQAGLPKASWERGVQWAATLRRARAIIGVFDEGCMGMYNAIIPDELLHPMGLFKERLSQSALYARMQATPMTEARAVYQWLLSRGMRFVLGIDEASELTEGQVLEQCRMYIAALRIANEFGCAAIGIQYQQGLKDLCPASDLAESMLNNVDRPPVQSEDGRTLFAGEALPHFNEVDECAGVDALVTYAIWRSFGVPPETTLHDVRWGESYPTSWGDQFVWVLEISGAVPAAHFRQGWADATSERQPPMYFQMGGGTVKGVSKPGIVVWSRVFVEPGRLCVDLGLADVVDLPKAESDRRSAATTPQWPMMHAVFRGIGRDGFMARHRSNHVQVAYAPDENTALELLAAKAGAFSEMGMAVHLCGSLDRD